MVQLTVGTNTERKTIVVESSSTLNEVFEENEIDTTNAAIHLNGALIAGVDANSSLEELGIQDGGKAVVIAVKKADSAR